MRPIGILVAMAEEFDALGVPRPTAPDGPALTPPMVTAQLADRPVVIGEAGIGKVSAGLTAALMVERFSPSALIMVGVAGGLDPALHVGDVVVGDRLVMADYGRIEGQRLIPYQPEVPPLPFLDNSHGYDLAADLAAALRPVVEAVSLPPLPTELVGSAAQRPGQVLMGSIVTGDAFVNCEATRIRLQSEFGGHAVEMEGAAVAQVATRVGLPVVNIRCLSDLAGADSALDFGRFLPFAAERAALVLRQVLPILP